MKLKFKLLLVSLTFGIGIFFNSCSNEDKNSDSTFKDLSEINKFASMDIINYTNTHISKVTIFDVSENFPDFPPLLISQSEEMNDDKFRVLSLWVYADNYEILDLKEILLVLLKWNFIQIIPINLIQKNTRQFLKMIYSLS